MESVKQYAHVHSVVDVDYDIIPDASIHSLFYDTGAARILKGVTPELAPYLQRVFELGSAHNVWTILLEFKNQPVYVVRNLAHAAVSPNFRRVLRVDMELMNDIYPLVHSNQTLAPPAPLL